MLVHGMNQPNKVLYSWLCLLVTLYCPYNATRLFTYCDHPKAPKSGTFQLTLRNETSPTKNAQDCPWFRSQLLQFSVARRLLNLTHHAHKHVLLLVQSCNHFAVILCPVICTNHTAMSQLNRATQTSVICSNVRMLAGHAACY